MADDLGPTLPEPGEPLEAGDPAAGPDNPAPGDVRANTTPHVPQPAPEPDTTEIADPLRGEGGSRAAPDGPVPA